MRALIALVLAAALTAAVPAVAGAEQPCAPEPPKRQASQYRTGQHNTPVGAAELRGGPDHFGVTLGRSYVFADGDPNGGLVYGAIVPPDNAVLYGVEFRIGGGEGDRSTHCVESYR